MPRVLGRLALALTLGSLIAPGGSCGPRPTPESASPAPALAPAPAPAPRRSGDPETSDGRARPDEIGESTTGAVEPSSVPTGILSVHASVQPGLAVFAQEWSEGGTLWIGPLEGNGGRDVLVFVPDGPDPNAPFELVYHFHGTYSEHVEHEREGVKKRVWVGWDRLEQTMQACGELQSARAANVALVYPFSAGKRLEPEHRGWSNVAYDRMWMDPARPPDFRDDFDTLDDEVRELLVGKFGVTASKLPSTVIAEGHSAGGIALLNVARSKTKRVREYLFQDAGFRDWADGTHNELVSSNARARVTLVITHKGMTDPFAGRRPWCRELEEAKSAYSTHESACRADPASKPTGSELDCEALALAHEEWPDYEAWCEGMKSDMVDEPRVFVHRTKVVHANQPRRFTGGLDLPAEWHRAP